MKTLRRIANVSIFDTATLEVQPEVSPEGFLRCAVNATRAGIFIYADENGQPVRALRGEDQVFHPASVSTLAGKPITRTHPSHLLDAASAKGAMVGSTGDTPQRAQDFLRVLVSLFDADTIGAVLGGKKEVSCGYTADILDDAGVHPVFGAYDVVQENIRYNHLAVAIEEGRGGPNVRMLLDSSTLDSKKEKTMAKETDLMKLKLGDVEHDVTPALHGALTHHLEGLAAQHKKAMDDLAEKFKGLDDYGQDMEALAAGEGEAEEDDEKACAKMDAIAVKSDKAAVVKARMAKMLGQMLGLKREVKAKMDAAEAAAKEAPAKLAEAAKAQAVLVATVMALDEAAKPADLFTKTAGELKRLAILARDPKAVLDGKSEDFVEGRFTAVAATVKPTNLGEVLGAMLLDTTEQEKKDESAAAPARKTWTPEPLSASTRPAAKK